MIKEMTILENIKRINLLEVLGLATLLIKKKVLELITIINQHLEDLKEKAIKLKSELTYLTFMRTKMLKLT